MATNTVLAQELETLKRKVQLLEDKEAIRDVLVRYAFTSDLHRTENFLKLWTDNLIFNADVAGKVDVVKGKDELRKHTSGRLRETVPIRAHLQVDYHIEVDGDTAVATGYQLIPQRWEGGYGIWTCSMRQFRLQRVDGRWLINEAISRLIGGSDCQNLVPMEL